MSLDERARHQEVVRRWRQANKWRLWGMRRRYEQSHPTQTSLEARASAKRRYWGPRREQELERSRLKLRVWKQQHPELVWLQRQRRRAKEGAIDLTVEQWHFVLKKYGNRCAYCGVKGLMTIDHVVPVAKGGKTTVQNVVPACRRCNSAKGVGVPRVSLRLALL